MYAPRESPARPVAEAVAWLWRLGPVLDTPAPGAVGFGSDSEAAGLRELVARGDLSGAVVFAGGRTAAGVARFPAGERVRGDFTVLDSGTPVIESSLGVHAARRDHLLFLGAHPEAWWQRLEYHWVLEALEPFLEERLDRQAHKLPPVGVVRLDDAPGTAQLQMQDRSHADSRQSGRLRSMRLAFGKASACLNTAVAAEALAEGRRVPLDEVWPDGVAQIHSGVKEGAFEPVCHGLLHLVPEKMERGEVDWLEFGELDREEASRRLEIALDWQERALGRRPATFVAPAWGYSEGALQAATDHGLAAWLPPEPGPLLDGPHLRETLNPALEGIHKLDYTPLARWAAAGRPPTLVLHGGLFDKRMELLRPVHDYASLARLFLKRDVLRIPYIDGVKWIGAGEYADLIRAHDKT